MSEYTQAYSSPLFESLSIQLPSPTADVPSNDFLPTDILSNEAALYPIYQRGYDEGEKDGYTKGSENGYDRGYHHGKRDGYEEGYNEGIYQGLWFGTAWTVVASMVMFGMKSRY